MIETWEIHKNIIFSRISRVHQKINENEIKIESSSKQYDVEIDDDDANYCTHMAAKGGKSMKRQSIILFANFKGFH